MSYITTGSGIHFDPVAPEPMLLDIRDIAHSLSNICRANGHVRHFYSVGQHSINCCREAERRGYSWRVQMACLLHDGSEAYLSDVTRPIKGLLTEYLEIEDRLQNMIWERFIGSPLTEEEKKLVFQVDDDILSMEFRCLMPEDYLDGCERVLSQPDMSFRDMRDVEEEFVRLADKYLKQLKVQMEDARASSAAAAQVQP